MSFASGGRALGRAHPAVIAPWTTVDATTSTASTSAFRAGADRGPAGDHRRVELGPGDQTGRAVVDFTVFMLISVRSDATPGSSPRHSVKNRWYDSRSVAATVSR
jgi:hypothetical protein